MRSAQQWLDAYAESHQHPVNKLIHWLCIPWIMVSLLGFLASVPCSFGTSWLNWSAALIVSATIFYALLSIPLAIGMALVGCGMLAITVGVVAPLPLPLWQSSLLIFVVAWIGQFIGHKLEGKKPSFFQDVQFLLIGPMWLLATLYRRLGIAY